MKIRVGQLGARMYYGVARTLAELNMLEGLYTDITINKNLPKLLTNIPIVSTKLKKLKNRKVADIHSHLIHHLPDYGGRLLWKSKKAKTQLERDAINHAQGVQLERYMMKDGLRGADAVAMIGSSSANIFKAAKEKGIVTIKEQIIAPSGAYKNIISSEIETYRDWQHLQLSIESIDYWQKISEEEWKYADHIICGSMFVKDMIESIGGPVHKSVVIPYGIPLHNSSMPLKSWKGDRKLRVLFVGAVGLRKGAHYLIQASKALSKECDIRFCGNVEFNDAILLPFKNNIELKGHVSRDEIGAQYEWADVLVLPSLFEGSATVGYEAMQYNLPMIVTPNAGQLLTDGKEGWIIEVKSTESIVNAIGKYLQKSDLIHEHSKNIQQLAKEGTYEMYAQRLKAFFGSL